MIIDDICLIQIMVTIIFCVVFCIFDIKSGIVPNRLNYVLLAFGFISNLILTIITGNIKFILFSIISWSITYTVTLLLWQLNVWGGGDVKLFSSIASVIPFGVRTSFFDVSPVLSFYPFSFTVMVNSILVSFPFLVLLLIYLIIKNGTKVCTITGMKRIPLIAFIDKSLSFLKVCTKIKKKDVLFPLLAL